MSIIKAYRWLIENMLADTHLAIDYWGYMDFGEDGKHQFMDAPLDWDGDPEPAGESFDDQGYLDKVCEWCKWVQAAPDLSRYTKRFIENFTSEPWKADYDSNILNQIAQFIAFGEYKYN